MPMNINITEQGHVSIVAINSSIDLEDISTIKNRLSDLIGKKQYKIVLNLKNVGYLSSKFLAVLIDSKAMLVKQGGDIVIANANSLIVNLFDMTRLNKKIKLFESVDDAVASFGTTK
jgi:anti-sigma B factor antagonist